MIWIFLYKKYYFFLNFHRTLFLNVNRAAMALILLGSILAIHVGIQVSSLSGSNFGAWDYLTPLGPPIDQ
jgi:hypothetical protein